MKCQSTYPGGVTLAGRAVECDDPRGKGHDGDHGNSFAARWWTDDDGPRGWGTPERAPVIERDPYDVYGTPEHEAWLIEMERIEG